MQSPDDLSLLQAIVQRRDREAFAELVERHSERAFNLAYRILGDSALAEDAVQEAMLSIWSSVTSLPETDAQGWILRIVVNRSRFLRRTTVRRAKREKGAASESGRLESTVAETVDRDEVLAALRTHLQQLPEAEVQLLTYCYGANMSHREIGQVLNMPNRTVTFKIQQALERLRASLATAGLVAVAPLLGAESLFEALTTGVKAPSGLTAKIMSLIDNGGVSTKTRLRRRRLTSVQTDHTPMIAVILAAVVALLAALVWSSGTKPKPAAQPQPPVSSSVETALPSPNLIQDPGFELQNTDDERAQLSAPWFVEGPALSGPDDAARARRSHTGEKDGFLEGYFGKGDPGWSAILQTVTVKPNTNYTLGIWEDNSNSACFTHGQFGVRTRDGNVVAKAPIPLSPTYTHLQLEFNSGNNTTLVFFAGYEHLPTEVLKRPDGQSNSFMHLDDVSLFETGGVRTRPSP